MNKIACVLLLVTSFLGATVSAIASDSGVAGFIGFFVLFYIQNILLCAYFEKSSLKDSVLWFVYLWNKKEF